MTNPADPCVPSGTSDPRNRPSAGRRSGYALIISMSLLMLLAVLSTTFVSLTRLERQTASSFVDQVRARMIAQSGIDFAVGQLVALDRVQPWSGHYAHTDAITHAVYIDRAPGSAPFPSGLEDAGADRWMYGELVKPIGAADTATTRVYGKSPRDLGVGGVASFHAGTVTVPGQAPYGYSGPALGETGIGATYTRTASNPGDFFVLKVVDCASMINVNDTNTLDGSGMPRLTRILNNLGAELSPPIPTLGTRIMTERAANGRFPDKASLRQRVFGATPAEWDRVKDFVTAHGWQDPGVTRVPFAWSVASGNPAVSNAFLEADENGDGKPDGRSPININTAPREVLVACILGLRADYSERTTTGLTKKAVAITSAATARQIADWIIETRATYHDVLSGATFPTSYPHVDWMHTCQDCFDSMTGTGGSPALTQVERDLLKANFGPNTDIKKFNPDNLFVDPDKNGRSDFSYVDKSDLTAGSTEICFGSMGYYEIGSIGRVLDNDGVIRGEGQFFAVVKTYEVLRLTSQKDFETDRVTDPGLDFTAKAEGGYVPAVVSLPEYPHRRNPGDSNWAASYDGQLILNGFVDHRTTPTSFMAGFTNRLAPGDPPAKRLSGIRPVGADLTQYGAFVSPAGGLFPNPSYKASGLLNGSMVYPFGAHLDVQRRGSPDYLMYDPSFLNQDEGTIEFWYKPEVDLVGVSGWEKQTVWLMDLAGSSNYDAVRMRIKNRKMQVALYFALQDGGFGGGGFGFGAPVVVGFGPPADPAPGGGAAGSGSRDGVTSGTQYVTLMADLTLHSSSSDPRTWNPHTWHHIELSWKGTEALLLIDGEEQDRKTLPGPFWPNKDLGTAFGAGSTPPRWMFGAYTDSDHDSMPRYDSWVVGTVDNICAHPKQMHAASFAPRSRYHDVTHSDYTIAPGAGVTDVNGRYGLYQRKLTAVEALAASQGDVTLLTLSCTHWHPPHFHSAGSHDSSMAGTIGLGHVSLGLKSNSTNYAFDYDNCAGSPCRVNEAGQPKWITVKSGDQVTLLVKLELAENTQIPHNESPIVDDITITYTTGPKILSWRTFGF